MGYRVENDYNIVRIIPDTVITAGAADIAIESEELFDLVKDSIDNPDTVITAGAADIAIESEELFDLVKDSIDNPELIIVGVVRIQDVNHEGFEVVYTDRVGYDENEGWCFLTSVATNAIHYIRITKPESGDGPS